MIGPGATPEKEGKGTTITPQGKSVEQT